MEDNMRLDAVVGHSGELVLCRETKEGLGGPKLRIGGVSERDGLLRRRLDLLMRRNGIDRALGNDNGVEIVAIVLGDDDLGAVLEVGLVAHAVGVGDDLAVRIVDVVVRGIPRIRVDHDKGTCHRLGAKRHAVDLELIGRLCGVVAQDMVIVGGGFRGVFPVGTRYLDGIGQHRLRHMLGRLCGEGQRRAHSHQERKEFLHCCSIVIMCNL